MRKRTILTLCVPAMLFLAACVTTAPPPGQPIVVPGTGGNTVISTDPGSVTISDPRIAQVQSVAAKLCNFVPTASFILKMIGSVSTVDAGLTLAQTICAAVTPAPRSTSARALKRPTINGIPIEGRFVRS